MNHNEIYDVTIIGGGPAGLFSTFYSGMRAMKTKLIDFQPQLGGKVNVYPEKIIWDIGALTPVTGEKLMEQMIEQASTFDPEIVLNEKIIKVEKPSEEQLFILTAANGNKHISKTVILAVGGGILKPIKLNMQGADRFEVTNLHYVIQSLNKFKNKDVMILGGGNAAIDWAVELEPVAKSVKIVHRRDQFDCHESQLTHVKKSTIQIHSESTVKQLVSTQDNTKINSVLVKNNKTGKSSQIKVDDVIISYGFERELSFIKDSPLDIELINDYFINGTAKSQTSIDGLFAAGDILAFDGKVHLIAGAFTDATNAVNQAKHYLDPSSTATGRVSSHNSRFEEKNKKIRSHLYVNNS
ncbi:NAD(P)/FAD-dependent oxidoreductase [Virgibacillus necropolis]|uniref:Ferredoxin--NADP reductase n=1 Tax=Virgibacillus necropolis TaxID=163877 RepID=A0A221M8E8_9BACI|nr:NAD(P)/FAD-dependent oxidoreductase [Virgibacillus necropolis]ASN03917.1 thioredoxin reductase [Virgibacillus necropolis]